MRGVIISIIIIASIALSMYMYTIVFKSNYEEKEMLKETLLLPTIKQNLFIPNKDEGIDLYIPEQIVSNSEDITVEYGFISNGDGNFIKLSDIEEYKKMED